MRIGIIGSGHIGGTLTRRLRTLGHDVLVANSRGPESLADLAVETGARAVAIGAVTQDRELVIVAIPLRSIPDLDPAIFANVPVLVDTSNYYPQQRDGLIAEIEAGEPESGWVERHLRHPVIKAFNSIHAEHLFGSGAAAGTPDRIALPVSGDDAATKATVIAVIDELGFDAVDTGTIARSWRQQPGTPAYGADLPKAGLREALDRASPERSAEWRAKPGSPAS
ncbi:NADPH-dependent F420 reductase [Sphingomonas glacialis]|uniref:NADP oxidoreductase n=1 Tax=Sphingomonas glacialis TaxID=658225 RepID=A0A502FY95_9SPHN|nr:NAD(P)-binding domain-containing protein [Sphingomonas glacialis]TPG54498.1 NADP oxidoreductase [Sphingomonas glacialis]